MTSRLKPPPPRHLAINRELILYEEFGVFAAFRCVNLYDRHAISYQRSALTLDAS